MADPIAAAPARIPAAPTPAPADALPVDVVVTEQETGAECTIDAAALERLQKRVNASLMAAARQTFKFFTVKPAIIAHNIADKLVTADNVCAALLPEKSVTKENHNDLRTEYMGSGLALGDARAYGVIGTQFPVERRCPEGYDWTNPLHYAGVTNCEEVLEAQGDDRIPAVMYAVPTTPAAARAILSDMRSPKLYSRYTNDGPISCEAADAPASFHSLATMPGLPNAEYIIRIEHGGAAGSVWDHWSLRPTCSAVDSEGEAVTHTPETLMVDFGMRVFVPVQVATSEGHHTRSLVFTSVAAVPQSENGRNIIRMFAPNYPFKRFVGGEFAKSILVRARTFGWQVDGDRAPLLVEKQDAAPSIRVPQ